MKKLLVIALCLVMLFSLCACSNTRFLAQNKVDRLVEKYSADGKLPQVEMVLSYKTYTNSTPVRVRVVYDLSLDKTPITVLSFIKLLTEGRYSHVVIDEKNTSTKYFSIGKYTYTEAEEKRTYDIVDTSKTFVGEFKNNNFEAYGDGEFAKCSMFSLAMYHDVAASKTDEKEQQAEYQRAYNSADGRVMLAYGVDALNYKNYAIFAQPASFQVAYGTTVDGVVTYGDYSAPSKSLSSDILTQLLDIGYVSNVTIDGATHKPLKIDVSFAMVANGIHWSAMKDDFLVDAE